MVTLCALALSCFALVSEEASSEIDAKRATRLVEQLGADSYEERNAAQDVLFRMGLKSKSALEAAANSQDPEIRTRAARVLAQLPIHEIQERWVRALAEGKTHPLLGDTGAKAPGPAPARSNLENEEESKARQAKMLSDQTVAPDDRKTNLDLAVRWLAMNQEAAGFWNSAAHGAVENADLEQTALSLLAILSAGHSEKVGQYKDNIRRAVRWLREHQQTNGSFVGTGNQGVDGIAHSLATLAILQAADMANVPDTTKSAKLGVDYLVSIHRKRSETGQFEFGRTSGTAKTDLLTTALCALIMKAAKRLKYSPLTEGAAGNPNELLTGTKDEKSGLHAFLPGGRPNSRATFAACVTRASLGGATKEELTPTLAQALKEYDGLSAESADPLFNWLAAILAFDQGGETWQTFHGRLKETLHPSQRMALDWCGSWDPSGTRQGFGRVGMTALNTLSLTVYFRYLPLYR
jgi:hypothetical protein